MTTMTKTTTMPAGLFQHELGKTSAVFGRNDGVTLVFKGDAAMTNGKQIILPSLPQGAEVPVEDQAIMRGYADHEAGHVRHTDFGEVTAHAYRSSPAAKVLANALEDVRLERLVRREYPGSERNLRATATAVNQRFDASHPQGSDSWENDAALAAMAITWAGRAGYGGPLCSELLGRCSPWLQEAAKRWVGEIGESTREVCDLADRVLAELQDHVDEPPQEEQPEQPGEDEEQPGEDQGDEGGSDEPGESPSEGDGDEGESGDSGDSGDEGDGESGEDDSDEGESGSGAGEDDSDEDDGDGSGSGEGSEPGEGDEPGDQAPSEGADGDPGEDQGDGLGDTPNEAEEDAESAQGGRAGSDVDDMLDDFELGKEVEARTKSLGKGVGGYQVASTEWDQVFHRDDPAGSHRVEYRTANGFARGDLGDCVDKLKAKGPADYDQVRAEIGSHVSGMRRKLERALLAKERRDWAFGLEDGRLDNRRMASALAGRVNVFKRRDDRVEMNTALSVLVDLSSSMGDFDWLPNGNRMKRSALAQSCVVSLCEAMEHTGVEYEVLGFMAYKLVPGPVVPGVRGRSGNRPLGHVEFKRFEERLVQAKGSLAALPDVVNGFTPTGESVLFAYERLKRRDANRHVMLVITDGLPGLGNDHGTARQHARMAVDYVGRQGVDVVGIGIGMDSVSEYFPHWASVMEPSDLSGKVMDQVARILLGQRVELDNSKLLGVA